MLRYRFQHRPPTNAGEGVRDVQLHPRAVRPRLRHHLHRVDESLGSARTPGPVLAAPHRLPGGELAEALAPGDRANPGPSLRSGVSFVSASRSTAASGMLLSAIRSQRPPIQASARGCSRRHCKWLKRMPVGPGAEVAGALVSAR